MAQRIAASMSLVAFIVCLVVGAQIGNPFGTVVSRAIVAMLITLVIGLIVGTMATWMLEENIKVEEEKIKNGSVRPQQDGR